jgi:hypothetical protein
MFVPLPSLTDRKGERMNGVMNHRSGGGFQRIIKKGPSECLEYLHVTLGFPMLSSMRGNPDLTLT